MLVGVWCLFSYLMFAGCVGWDCWCGALRFVAVGVALFDAVFGFDCLTVVFVICLKILYLF